MTTVDIEAIVNAEAVTALEDPRAITAPDLVEPTRLVTIGMSGLLRVLFVVHTELQCAQGVGDPTEDL